jgi:hypothetical protein
MSISLALCKELYTSPQLDNFVIVKIPGVSLNVANIYSITYAIGDELVTDEEKKFADDEYIKNTSFRKLTRLRAINEPMYRCALLDIALFRRIPELAASSRENYGNIDYADLATIKTKSGIIKYYLSVLMPKVKASRNDIIDIALYLHNKFHCQ